MPADTTGLYHLCPFCDEPFSSITEVKKHVTDTEEGEHYNINGFEMDRTITVTFNPYERLTMTEKIIEAGKKLGEPLDQSDAQTVSEESDEAKNKILRIWNESDLETDVPNRSKIKWNDLTEKQKNGVLYYYFNKEKELNEIVEHTNYASTSSLERSIQNNGWFLEDEFLPDNIEDHAIKYRLSSAPTSDVEETEEEDIFNILDECNIEYTATINLREKSFDAITKLIENGYKDIAHKLYHDETLEYKND